MSAKMSFHIEHIGLKAKDTGKLAAWYERILGLRIIYRNQKEPPTFFFARGGRFNAGNPS
jgi:catechol 2,3-dioxygenase-like lactoylglutathione lyase family enzyme